MYQYANGFSCALSGNGNEFVLCFAQQCPSFDGTGKLDKVTKEPVASLIMSADKAKELARALSKRFAAPSCQVKMQFPRHRISNKNCPGATLH